MKFLHNIRKKDDERCVFCHEIDTAEHTLFSCVKWSSPRSQLNRKLGFVLSPENLIDTMIESKDNWLAVEKMMSEVLVEKTKWI